ncbi:hypothetical protein D5S09_14740 [Lactobacillus sp. LMY-20]|nr:hypothetical protein [Lactobacillus sp. LMY-20]
MIKVYRKTANIKAEQFDCSDDMFNRYGLIDRGGHIVDGLHVDNMCFIPTLEGRMKINLHDWIATGVNGEHWAVSDDVFKQTYAELPVISRVWADTIEEYKANHYRLSEIFTEWDLGYGGQDVIARAWLDGYVVEVEK